MNHENVTSVFLFYEFASVHTYHTGVYLRLTLVTVIYYKHLAARRCHQRVVTGTEDTFLRLFEENGVIFVSLEGTQRGIGYRVSNAVVLASVVIAGEGKIIYAVVLEGARPLGNEAVLILPCVSLSGNQMHGFSHLKGFEIEFRSVNVVSVLYLDVVEVHLAVVVNKEIGVYCLMIGEEKSFGILLEGSERRIRYGNADILAHRVEKIESSVYKIYLGRPEAAAVPCGHIYVFLSEAKALVLPICKIRGFVNYVTVVYGVSGIKVVFSVVLKNIRIGANGKRIGVSVFCVHFFSLSE